jgi:acetyl-CoA carboxylase carboxyl transferase subunit beta
MVDKSKKYKCEACGKDIGQEVFIKNLNVCPYCGHHVYIGCRRRLDITVDEDSFEEMDSNMRSVDFLKFQDLKRYNQRLAEASEKTGLNEAIITGEARIDGYGAAIGIMDFGFMGGSMGSVVGEKIKNLCNRSIEKSIPLIIFSSSGGARMQEGIISLMQMAKTVSSIGRVMARNIPYISVITNPTTGGVSASFSTIADIIIAEPGALFCFAGPRVVRQTMKKDIPDDFGLSERNLANGQVDMIVKRSDMKETLARLIRLIRG